LRNKTIATIGLVVTFMVAMVTPAFATADADAVTAVSAGATTLGDTLQAVAVFVLPIAAGLLAISFGWKMARKFVRA